ncbi:diaminopimelate decarboxylase [bacterium]|nr:diaminopimelate decarboxylase [bacterium]
MDHFDYKNGTLHAESVSLEQLAKELGTPFYCYSSATIARHYTVFNEALQGLNHQICYAVKANDSLAILHLFAKLGAGADVVSEGEIRKALHAGIPANRIVFSGVGKTREEMHYALSQNIMQFNVESEPELDALNEVAASLNVKAPVAFRINPDVDPKTHAKISTGQKESKFGIDMKQALALYTRAAGMPHIAVKGVSVHIGSQLLDLQPFEMAFNRVASFVEDLRGNGLTIESIDVGGGFGIRYHEHQTAPTLTDYAAIIRRTLSHLNLRMLCEPGRVMVGNAGVLVSRVLYVKQGASRTYLILDAGMNDLIRPSLYGAHHDIVPVREASADAALTPFDVVGPVCETGDIFAEQRALPHLKPGDLVAFRSAGAYGAVMAGTYNARPRLAECMVKDANWAITHPRQTYEDLIKHQSIPSWL